MPPSPADNPRRSARTPIRRRSGADGFTLIELLLVMALLVIVSALAAPRMISFFRGRALSQESRRMLALAHYAQSRAVAEGVPVTLWFNPANSTYGQAIQAGYVETDGRASSFTLESSLTLEVPHDEPAPVSESGDENLGQPDDLPAIRFTPDGCFALNSVPRLIIRQGSEAALQLAPTANRLDYEILPATTTR